MIWYLVLDNAISTQLGIIKGTGKGWLAYLLLFKYDDILYFGHVALTLPLASLGCRP